MLFIQRTKNQVNRTKQCCFMEQYWTLDKIKDGKYYLTRPGETKVARVYFKGQYVNGREHLELKVNENDTYHDKLENITCFERYVATPDWLKRFREKHKRLEDSATRIQSLVRGFLVRKGECTEHDWVFMGRQMYEPSMFECRKCDRQTTTPLKRKCEEEVVLSPKKAKIIYSSDSEDFFETYDSDECCKSWSTASDDDFSLIKEGLMQT